MVLVRASPKAGTHTAVLLFFMSERALHVFRSKLVLLRPDVHQILCAEGVLAGPHGHTMPLAEGDVFALHGILFVLLGDTLLCRSHVNGDIEKDGYAQSNATRLPQSYIQLRACTVARANDDLTGPTWATVAVSYPLSDLGPLTNGLSRR